MSSRASSSVLTISTIVFIVNDEDPTTPPPDPPEETPGMLDYSYAGNYLIAILAQEI